MAGAGASSTPSSPACVINRGRAPGLKPARPPPQLPSAVSRLPDQSRHDAGRCPVGLTPTGTRAHRSFKRWGLHPPRAPPACPAAIAVAARSLARSALPRGGTLSRRLTPGTGTRAHRSFKRWGLRPPRAPPACPAAITVAARSLARSALPQCGTLSRRLTPGTGTRRDQRCDSAGSGGYRVDPRLARSRKNFQVTGSRPDGTARANSAPRKRRSTGHGSCERFRGTV